MDSTYVVELGSHSLKVHGPDPESGEIRKWRFPWPLGQEVYTTGYFSRQTMERAVDALGTLRRHGVRPDAVIAIATGALRDARNRDDLLEFLEERLGTRVRVISGREEASLLAQGYLETSQRLPAVIADLGGGTLQIVRLGADQTILRDSLPLGAVRVDNLARDGRGVFDERFTEDYIRRCFEDAPAIRGDEVHVTGGTAKALSRIVGRSDVRRDELDALIERMRVEGPPPRLSPDRQRVFRAGALVLRGLLENTGAARLVYLKTSVGRIFLEHHARRLPHGLDARRQGDLARDLRLTRVFPAAPAPREARKTPHRWPPGAERP